MNQFKKEIKEKTKKKRNFYKIYGKSKNGNKVYRGSKVSRKRNEDDYLAAVSCFVIDENNNVLIEKRAATELEPGELDLVSGHIEENETATQAMIREYVEELHNGSEEEQEKARNEAGQNLKKLTELDLTFLDKGKPVKYFVQFYFLKTNLHNITKQKEEVEEIRRIPLEEVFELIRQGKTRIPYDKRFEEIFKQIREHCQTENRDIQKER